MPKGIFKRTKRHRKRISEALKGIKRPPMSEEHKKKISKALRGRKMPPRSAEHSKKISEANKGQIPWNKGLALQTNTGKTHIKENQRISPKTEFKKGNIPWNKGRNNKPKCIDCGKRLNWYSSAKRCKPCHNLFYKGKNHYNWRGGVTSLRTKIWRGKIYQEWRNSVFERDDYTCQNCGKRGGRLNADHLKPFALYPKLRFKVSNGRTLCMECHNLIGWRGNQYAYRQQ